ncbi:MAG: KTSC domain-containing protein, partial [Nanoarchaeota archaeon]|nr:KTSC domain-containing protein [Nanoarchaeota archaeon]
LVIEFNSGCVYKYFGVHPRIVVGMSNSESVGRYFHKNIRSNPLIKYKKVS